MSLFSAVKQFCLNQGLERTYCLGLSGGLDSTVLFHLLVNLRSLYPLKLSVIHVHHGLSPNADAWTAHCKKICEEFKVDFILHKINAKSSQGESPEEIARLGRYEIFSKSLAANDILLTAHQKDDQAETVLLQLFRGAGPKGLAAMARIKPFAQGFHGRPLLDFTREELKQYAEENQLQWINDESNIDVNFTRNFIRHEVLSVIESRLPSISNTLARVAEHCADAQTLLEQYVKSDFLACDGSKPNTLSVKKILDLNQEKQAHVLRMWFDVNNFPGPSTVKMQHILQDMLHARADKSPHIVCGAVELRRYRDDLYIMPCLPAVNTDDVFRWNLKEALQLPGRGMLYAAKEQRGLREDIKEVFVRFRQSSEICLLPGRKHHHSLKKLFQTWGVPSWQRDRIPLIFVEDELAVVPGFFMAEKFIAKGLELGWVIKFDV